MDLNTYQSVYRERLIEHLVLGELLKYSWLHDNACLEVSQPAIDRAGHDVVLEVRNVTRHVQFKSSSKFAKTSRQSVHLDLASKPSGCVVWTLFDPTNLDLSRLLFFGGPPGEQLPPIDELRVARHTRGNALGLKAERPHLRIVPRHRFNEIESVSDLYASLFGSPPPPLS